MATTLDMSRQAKPTTAAQTAVSPSFDQKYKANIEGLQKEHGVDFDSAKQMLISNLTAGGQYKGGGVLDYNVASKDANDYLGALRNGVQTQPKSYLDELTGGVDKIAAAQKAAQIQALRLQQQKATGQLNQQKGEAQQAYYGKRNQADATMAQNVQRLRELMAADGISASGENVTANIAHNAARQNVLGNLDLQEQQQLNDLDRRIADINDPAQEQAIINAIEAQRAQMLYDAMNRGKEFDYRAGRDKVMDDRYNTEFDYKKGRDAVADGQWSKSFGLQEGGLLGYYNGKPTFARDQFNADNDYRNRSLAQQAALASMRASGSKKAADSEPTVDEVYNSLVVSGVPEDQILAYLRQGKASPQAINEMAAFISQKKQGAQGGMYGPPAPDQAPPAGTNPYWLNDAGFYFPPF